MGDALSRLGQDTSIVGQSLSDNLGEGVRAVLGAMAATGAMYLISPSLTALMLLIIPPISFSSFFYGRYIRKISLMTQEAMGRMTKLAEERLSAHRTITAANTQIEEGKRYSEGVNNVYQLQRKETLANGVFSATNEGAGDVGFLGLLFYAGILIQSQEITVGAVTAMLIYIHWLEWSIQSEHSLRRDWPC